MRNKKGQELSVNTLILIILGVLILVFLIVGFKIGWDKIFPFIKPANNVKDVVDKCSLACSTNAVYEFCTTKRDVNVDEEITGLGKKFRGNCLELGGVRELGVESCPAIQCKDISYSSKVFAELSCESGVIKELGETAPTDNAEARAYLGTTGKKVYFVCENAGK